MLRKTIIISAVIYALSLGNSLAAQTIDPTTPPHDPETEQDYGPGFWDTDVDTTLEDHLGGETNEELPVPQEGGDGLSSFLAPLISFPQTLWNECADMPTGNYADYNCTTRRKVSVILDGFLKKRLMSCVDEGLKTAGGGTTQDFHIVHAGITGDARHSPNSLHAHNRAIDVKSIKVLLTNGSTKEFTYSKVGNRPFYENLRKCWGGQVSAYNGCPLYRGNKMLTGSIGWENAAHGRHMHLSVPYCLSGRYGSGVWQR